MRLCIVIPSLLYLSILVCVLFDTPFLHAVTQFHFFNITVSAESVGGSTPGARVTWNTTVPPGCVTSVRVEFRTNSPRGHVAANYTTIPIHPRLRSSRLVFSVVVTTELRSPGGMTTTHILNSRSNVQVLVGGNSVIEIVCMCMILLLL